MAIRDLTVRAVHVLLPRGRKLRRLRFGPAAGARMEVDFSTNLAVYLGLYERELHPWINTLLKPGVDAFDIGGHIGYDALMFAKLSRARVLSVESDTGNVRRMERTFEANRDLSLSACQAFVSKDIDDTGHVTIDALASRHFVPGFIKIDIEGAEADALFGAEQTLRTARPNLIVETHGVEVEARCIGILNGHEYQCTVVNPRRGWRERRGEFHNRWICCVPRGSTVGPWRVDTKP